MDSIIQRIAKDLVNEICDSDYVGIGSGRTVSDFVDALATLKINKKSKFIPSSHQISFKLKEKGFDTDIFPNVNSIRLYIDSVDQIEERSYYMIKGGGGALLKEKALMYNSKRVVLLVQEKKIAKELGLDCPVPIEVMPFARQFVVNYLKKMGSEPQIRKDIRGFPVFTENGNMILDVTFKSISAPIELEQRLKNQPGVIEVGIFTKRPSHVYVIKTDSFEKLSPK